MLPQPHFRTKLILLPTWFKIGLVALPIGFIIGISAWALTAVNAKLDKINVLKTEPSLEVKPGSVKADRAQDPHEALLLQMVSEEIRARAQWGK
jgi:hypothetical protein